MDRPNWLFSSQSRRSGGACLALLLALPVVSEAGLFHHKRHDKQKGAAAAPAQVLGIVVEPLRDGLRLQIDCSSKVRFHWGTLEKPHGFYVDLDGAQIARTLRQLSVGTAGVTDVWSDNRGPDQVRIALGLCEGVTPHVERSDDGRSVTIRIQSPIPDAALATPMPEATPVQEQTQRLPRPPETLPYPTPKERTEAVAGPRITALDVENLSAAEALVRIHVEGKLASPHVFRLNDPPRLVLELPGATHCIASPPRFAGTGPLSLGSVWSAQFTQDPPVARVVIRLPRSATPYAIEPRDASGDLRVRVGSPASATATPVPSPSGSHFRRGFYVGIDPGHGGSDPGALNPAIGVCEKNITLDIASRLARLLEEAGVRTSMTRRNDRRLETTERIAFVARGDEDVFVSIHCDAIEGRPEWTGITTYFHGGSASSRALATALQSGLPAATGLPDRGIRTDFTRFPGHGFYVLRDARMPAVLIECGYVSHGPTARSMKRSEFRQQVAQGIADGLRKYWEDRRARTPVASRR